MSHSERRSSDRYRLWFPVELFTDDQQKHSAICYDVSTTGLLIGSVIKLPVGEEVQVRFRVMPAHANPARVQACVTRVADNVFDRSGAWPYLIAMQFDDPFPEIEPLLQIAAQNRDRS